MQNTVTNPRGIPLPLSRLMSQPLLEYVARLALASPFFISGIVKLMDLKGATAEVGGLGLQPAAIIAALVILVQLGGSVLFMTRKFCWLGAGMLACFTVFATLLAHSFWNFPAAERGRQTAIFLEHVAIVGGFAAAAILAHRTREP